VNNNSTCAMDASMVIGSTLSQSSPGQENTTFLKFFFRFWVVSVFLGFSVNFKKRLDANWMLPIFL